MSKTPKQKNPTIPVTPASSTTPKSVVEFFRESPLTGVELDLERDRDSGRDIDL
jgi:hypothetical protein